MVMIIIVKPESSSKGAVVQVSLISSRQSYPFPAGDDRSDKWFKILVLYGEIRGYPRGVF